MISIQLDATEMKQLSEAYGFLATKMLSVIAKGLTDTATDAKKAVYADLPKYLDRPTPWIMRSLFVFPAEKKETPIQAAVQFKSIEYGRQPRHMLGKTMAPSALRSQIYGRDRDLKSSEQVMRHAGVTPSDKPFLVPAVGAKKNKYGNVTGAFMNKVLYKGVSGGSASLNPLEGGRSQATTRSGQYFVLYKDGEAVGIFQNKGKKKQPLPVFFFSKSPKYKQRLPFHQIVDGSIARTLDSNIDAALTLVIDKYWR